MRGKPRGQAARRHSGRERGSRRPSPPDPLPFPTRREYALPFPPLEVRFLVNQPLGSEEHDPGRWFRIVLDPAVESLREVLFLVPGGPRHRSREVARVDEAGVVVRFIRPIPPGGVELVTDDVNRPPVGAEWNPFAEGSCYFSTSHRPALSDPTRRIALLWPRCGFRRIPITDSDSFRSPIPTDSDQ